MSFSIIASLVLLVFEDLGGGGVVWETIHLVVFRVHSSLFAQGLTTSAKGIKCNTENWNQAACMQVHTHFIHYPSLLIHFLNKHTKYTNLTLLIVKKYFIDYVYHTSLSAHLVICQ